MAAFPKMTLTNVGQALQTKVLAGAKLTFTRIALGDGQLNGQPISPLTNMIHQTASVPVDSVRVVSSNTCQASGFFSNADIAAGFKWRETGLFAQDPDVGEILYGYTNAGDAGDWIPTVQDTRIEKYIYCSVSVANATTVNITIPSSDSFIPLTQKGQPNGVAPLEQNGNLTESKKPTYSAADVGADPTGTATQAVSTHNTSPDAHTSLFAAKQNKLTGAQGQVVGFDSQGNAQAQDPPGGGSGKRVCRFVVGTSTAGWTADDCDYLCDGTADDVEINAAIQALPSTGGEVVILDGTYNITATIAMNKDNVTLSGNGSATVLKRMWSGSGVITVTSDYCTVQNLQIDGNKSSYASGDGIYLSSSSNNIVIGNTCNNSVNGISLNFSDNNTITSNICIANTNGICLSGISSRYNAIAGNACNDNSNCGIFLSNSYSNAITGNTCNSNNSGIYFSNVSSGNTIIGNVCSGNANGIFSPSGSSQNKNITITGNTCSGNSVSGIALTSLTNSTIASNICVRGDGTPSDYTSSQYTIQMQTNTQDNIITGNNIMGKNYVDGGTNNTWANNKYQ